MVLIASDEKFAIIRKILNEKNTEIKLSNFHRTRIAVCKFPKNPYLSLRPYDTNVLWIRKEIYYRDLTIDLVSLSIGIRID